MGICHNCGKEITLKEEETKCDSCGVIVNYPCHSCKQWFSIAETKLCKTCGNYYCVNCGVCGINCQKGEWFSRIKEITGTLISEEQLEKLIELIEEIKIGKDRRTCPNGVSISYAKNRIKSCVVRMKGYRIKSQEDLEKFIERYKNITDVPLGTTLTINQSRESGSYGQEYRDVFNYAICCGKLKIKKITKMENDIPVEFYVYQRCELGQCKMLDLKNLIVKVCPNKNCKIKTYPLSQTNCCSPECKFKKGDKVGQFYPLKLKISNKDICQLNRGDFKREKDGKMEYN